MDNGLMESVLVQAFLSLNNSIGVCTNKKGDKYDGEWKFDKRNGYGNILLISRSI